MRSELLQGAITALSTLLVGYLLWQVQRDGRRRRRRTEIREELELLDRIEPSPVRDRLEARVQALLEAYEPASEPEPEFVRTKATVVADVMTAIGAVVLTVSLAIDVGSTALSLLLGSAAGAVVVSTAVTRGRMPAPKRRS